MSTAVAAVGGIVRQQRASKSWSLPTGLADAEQASRSSGSSDLLDHEYWMSLLKKSRVCWRGAFLGFRVRRGNATTLKNTFLKK